MPTVRDAAFELFREHAMTTVFGNPGSTELPMLADFPEDFRYVLGLQEAVAVGMADGYAQASGRPAHVNLHTAPGLGQRDGRDLQRPGEQVTAAGHRRAAGARPGDHAGEPHQPRRDPDAAPAGQVVASSRRAPRTSPSRSRHGDPPGRAAAAGSGLRLAADGRLGGGGAGGRGVATRTARSVSGRAVADPEEVEALAGGSRDAASPVLVAGPEIDACGGWDAAVALAERQRLPVWASPAPGGGRLGFPEGHPNFRGVLPPAIGPVGRDARGLRPRPGRRQLRLPLLPPHTRAAAPEGASLVAITSDPDEAARAPMGDAIVADVGLTLAALAEAVPESDRDAPEPLPPPEAVEETDPLSPRAVHAALAEVFPEDGIVVLESPSSTLALRNQLRLSAPAATTSAPGEGSVSASPPRSACSWPSPTGRWSACSARAPPSTRSPGCGPPPPTGPGHLPGAPKRGVRDSQVVRLDRGGVRRARPRPAGARLRLGGRGLRGQGAPGRRARRASRRPAAALAADAPELVEVPVAPGWRWPEAARMIACRRHRVDRAPEELAAGTPSPFGRPRAGCSARTGSCRGRSTSSATPPTPAPTASFRRPSSAPATPARSPPCSATRRRDGIPVTLRVGRHQPQRTGTGGRHPGRRPPALQRGRASRRAAPSPGCGPGPCSPMQTACSPGTGESSAPIPPRTRRRRSAG